ncbi:MAG: hypothetical protein CNE98_01420 [Bacteroidetes bacterium MED-G17]|nr:MAG: hypothetical protein CNE98_01420 [Bacteroidetes bacterium MED-G17]
MKKPYTIQIDLKWPKALLILVFTVTFFSCDSLYEVLEAVDKTTSTSITEKEAISGLKQALEKGVQNSTGLLGKSNGFLNSFQYKIPFPSDAQKVEKTLRNLGEGALVDNMITAINQGAENAVRQSGPIFKKAIQDMTITDAINIVKGGNGAATNYLKQNTSKDLVQKFSPEIQGALDQAQATKYWTDVFTIYNKLPTTQQKINPNLNAFVTQKAISAIFDVVQKEENKIRANPTERSSEILKKVFAYADANK